MVDVRGRDQAQNAHSAARPKDTRQLQDERYSGEYVAALKLNAKEQRLPFVFVTGGSTPLDYLIVEERMDLQLACARLGDGSRLA
jgi:hypothetical protein